MKQIFDWLREQCKDRSESCYKSYLKLKSDEDYGCSFAYAHAVDLINEAEAKWKNDCCEWKFVRSDYLWESSCGHLYHYDGHDLAERGYTFCPLCGKRIKISEVE